MGEVKGSFSVDQRKLTINFTYKIEIREGPMNTCSSSARASFTEYSNEKLINDLPMGQM